LNTDPDSKVFAGSKWIALSHQPVQLLMLGIGKYFKLLGAATFRRTGVCHAVLLTLFEGLGLSDLI
ncbi:hypothetical protein Q4595_23535, partial [Wenyingzhuangia sp. 1_MG-2023]|nr:hypothetical protein [Wenyingzhuangia sp. 1_MG-2023]